MLVVEDDADIAQLIDIHLGDMGYEVDRARTGPDGLEKALSGRFSLVVLDIMLPDMDGFEVCRRVREHDPQLPILVLSAKTEEFDRVLGLELGADGYMTKPFSVRELIARIKAIFRRIEVDTRATEPPSRPKVRAGALEVDGERRTVTRNGDPIDLTNKEFDLLLLFVQNPGRPYSRQELLDLVWGYQYSGYSHTVNAHINRLRGKIEHDPSEPEFIKTVWGIGYKFADMEVEALP